MKIKVVTQNAKNRAIKTQMNAKATLNTKV